MIRVSLCPETSEVPHANRSNDMGLAGCGPDHGVLCVLC